MANFCKHCGSPIEPDSKFCESCGKPIKEKSEADIPKAEAPQPQVPTVQPEVIPEPPAEPEIIAKPAVEPEHVGEVVNETAQTVITAGVTEQAPQKLGHNVPTAPQPPYPPYPPYPPQPQQPEKPKKKKTGLIIGIVAGAAILLAAIITVVFVFILPSQSGDYFLYSYTKGDYDDYIFTLCSKGEKVPFKLSLSGNSAEIYDTEGELYGELRCDKNSQEGTLVYSGSSDAHKVGVSAEKGSVIITDGDARIEYRAVTPEIKKSVEGTYVLQDMRYDTYQEPGAALERMAQIEYHIANKLEINALDENNRSGITTITDGRKSLDISFSFNTMCGTSRQLISDGETNIFVCADENTFRFYSIEGGSVNYYIKPEAIDFNSVAGEYDFVRASGTDNSETIIGIKDSLNDDRDSISLTMRADGAGTVYYISQNLLELEVDPGDMLGKLAVSDSSSLNIYMAVNQNNLVIYCYEGFLCLTFKKTGTSSSGDVKPQSVDLSSYAGDYVLTDASTDTEDDYIGYLEINSYEIPSQLKLNNNASGQILFSDGDTFADFTITSSDLSGTINFTNSGNVYDLSAEVGENTIRLSTPGYADLTYQKPESIGLFSGFGDYVLTDWFSKNIDDVLEDSIVGNYKLPCKLSADTSGKGKLLYTDGSTDYEFQTDLSKMTFTGTNWDGKEYTGYFVLQGNELRMYCGLRKYVFTNAPTEALRELEGLISDLTYYVTGKNKTNNPSDAKFDYASVKISDNKVSISLFPPIDMSYSPTKSTAQNILERAKKSRENRFESGLLDNTSMVTTFTPATDSAGEQFDAFVTVSGNTLSVYDTTNLAVYRFEFEEDDADAEE